jgi:hypothetical protein
VDTDVPRSTITMGIAATLTARSILVLAGRYNSGCPASAFADHADVTWILDKAGEPTVGADCAQAPFPSHSLKGIDTSQKFADLERIQRVAWPIDDRCRPCVDFCAFVLSVR